MTSKRQIVANVCIKQNAIVAIRFRIPCTKTRNEFRQGDSVPDMQCVHCSANKAATDHAHASLHCYTLKLTFACALIADAHVCKLT